LLSLLRGIAETGTVELGIWVGAYDADVAVPAVSASIARRALAEDLQTDSAALLLLVHGSHLP